MNAKICDACGKAFNGECQFVRVTAKKKTYTVRFDVSMTYEQNIYGEHKEAHLCEKCLRKPMRAQLKTSFKWGRP